LVKNVFMYRYRYEETLHTHLPMKMEQTECSEMSAYKIYTLGNYPEESIQHSEQGESLKSRKGRLLNNIPEYGLTDMT